MNSPAVDIATQYHDYSLDEDLERELYELIDEFVGSVESALEKDSSINHGIKDNEIPDEHVKYIGEWLPSHMVQYAKTHRVKMEAIDPYKVYSWAGFQLARLMGENKNYLIALTISLMHQYLNNDMRAFPEKHLKKLITVAVSDCTHQRIPGNKEHTLSESDSYAIGANGVYMSFKSALSVKILSADS